MPEVRFYHLMSRRLDQALPELLEKALARGMRAIVTADSEMRLQYLDDLLWTYDPASFLAHGRAGGAYDAAQPVLLSCDTDVGHGCDPGRDLLMVTEGAMPDDLTGFALCCDLFDGRDDAAVAAARGRWKKCRDAGYALSCWQQDEVGRWHLKSEHKPQ